MFGLFCYAFHANCGLIRTFDASNVERLRDFIRHVYVDRRYTGERSFDKPPNVKTVREHPTLVGRITIFIISIGISIKVKEKKKRKEAHRPRKPPLSHPLSILK